MQLSDHSSNTREANAASRKEIQWIFLCCLQGPICQGFIWSASFLLPFHQGGNDDITAITSGSGLGREEETGGSKYCKTQDHLCQAVRSEWQICTAPSHLHQAKSPWKVGEFLLSSFIIPPLECSCQRTFVPKLDSEVGWIEKSSNVVLSFDSNESLLTHRAALGQL